MPCSLCLIRVNITEELQQNCELGSKGQGEKGQCRQVFPGACREEEAIVGITASVYLMRSLSYKRQGLVWWNVLKIQTLGD